ncbi:hypothetical protein CRG98_045224 [Punica granatum]|uniref:Uncharacterized protein n=1 Tax=Punica granatum TaxID=22663 RepID=A0A2I0HRQ4_PUNGR|nr:hypothetical protein CRG98_045224 [Punica granatum]
MRLAARSRGPFINKPHITIAAAIPARDRVMDFGKYKGQMLGTLPSTYLRWISKNLRARDFEEWSRLADEVLEDSVYKDKIEWEFAEGLLNGNRATTSKTESAVSELLEISERFGWDNNDKVGWSRVNFELLGTSKGGRIPRRIHSSNGKEGRDLMSASGETSRGDGLGITGGGGSGGGLVLSEEEKRRRERRERLKSKRSERHKYGFKSGANVVDEVMKKLGRNTDANANANANANADGGRGEGEEEASWSGSNKNMVELEEVYNPFPGRKGLLKKVRSLKHQKRPLCL